MLLAFAMLSFFPGMVSLWKLLEKLQKGLLTANSVLACTSRQSASSNAFAYLMICILSVKLGSRKFIKLMLLAFYIQLSKSHLFYFKTFAPDMCFTFAFK